MLSKTYWRNKVLQKAIKRHKVRIYTLDISCTGEYGNRGREIVQPEIDAELRCIRRIKKLIK